MVYEAPTGVELRRRGGSLTDKIASELQKIDDEMEKITLGEISLDSAQILVGSAGNEATAVDVTGDVTIDNLGETTIGAKKVAASMLKGTSENEGKLLVGDGSGGFAEKAITGAVAIDADGITEIVQTGIAPAALAVPDAQIIIGGQLGAGAAVAVSGDVTISRTGVVTIGAKKVTDAQIALAQHNILVGQDGGAAGEVTMGGDATITDAGVVTIGAKKVTAAKMASATEEDEGNIFVTTGTAYGVAEVPMSGDATIAANGAVTIENDAITTSKVLNKAITAEKLEDGGVAAGIDGGQVKFGGDNKTAGSIPLVFKIPVADDAGDYDIQMDFAVLVLDFWFIAVGAGHETNDTIQLKNGTDPITNAVQKGDTDKAVKRAGTIDPTYQLVEAGSNLRVTSVKATNCAADCYVLAMRVEAPG